MKPFDGVQPFFLMLKLKLKSSNSVWFLKILVGKNTLSKICKELIEGAGIKVKGCMFSNKTLQHIGISRMEVAHVLIEKGMRITGHRYLYFCCIFYSLVCLIIILIGSYMWISCLFRDYKSYAKYNALDSDIDQKACEDLIFGDSMFLKGKKVMFEDLVNEHLAIVAAEEVCGSLILFGFDFFLTCLLFSFSLVILLFLLQVKELGKISSFGDVKLMGTVAADEKSVLVPGHSNDTKYQVHLNVNNLNGCFFNFGSGFGYSSCFPFPKD